MDIERARLAQATQTPLEKVTVALRQSAMLEKHGKRREGVSFDTHQGVEPFEGIGNESTNLNASRFTLDTDDTDGSISRPSLVIPKKPDTELRSAKDKKRRKDT
jgi:hypothetical protein